MESGASWCSGFRGCSSLRTESSKVRGREGAASMTWFNVSGKKLFVNITIIQMKSFIMPLFESQPLRLLKKNISELHYA